MCGIFGLVTQEPSEETYNILVNLMKESEHRGREAAGISVVTKKGEWIINKKKGSPTDFIKNEMTKMKDILCEAPIVIGHTRAPTVGKPEDNNNNHPIESDHWIMVHNGSCTKVDKVPGYKYKGEVDSELLIAWLETEGFKGLGKLGSGSAALAIINKDNPFDVWLWRDTSPTIVGVGLDGRAIMFASTYDILKRANPKKWGLIPTVTGEETSIHDLYKISLKDFTFEKKEEIKLVFKAYDYRDSRHGNSYGYGYGSNAPASRWEDDDLPLFWDSKNKIWTLPPEDKSRYFYKSNDFKGWMHLANPDTGYISAGRDLIKKWDRDRRCHFILPVEEAIEKGYISKSFKIDFR